MISIKREMAAEAGTVIPVRRAVGHQPRVAGGTTSNAKTQFALRLAPEDFRFVSRLAAVRRMQLGTLLRSMIEDQIEVSINLDEDAQQVAQEQNRP